MCPPLASTKTSGVDTRPFSIWANPSLANFPLILNLYKQRVSQAGVLNFLNLSLATHPLGLSHRSTEISPAAGMHQSSLCFELGLPKGNGQVGLQPNHPWLTALFLYSGYCRHQGGFLPRIPVCRKLLARAKLEDSADGSGCSWSTQCLDVNWTQCLFQVDSNPQCHCVRLEFGVTCLYSTVACYHTGQDTQANVFLWPLLQ